MTLFLQICAAFVTGLSLGAIIISIPGMRVINHAADNVDEAIRQIKSLKQRITSLEKLLDRHVKKSIVETSETPHE